MTALQPLEHGQAEVDAGGHSAAGDPITVDHHSVLARGRTKKLEQTQVGPVGGGLVAVEQSRGTQDDRACAYRGDVAGRGAALGEEVEKLTTGAQCRRNEQCNTAHYDPNTHPNRLTDTSCCDHRQNPPIPKRDSCRCPSKLRIIRPPALLRTLLHGVLHPGLACTDAPGGRR